VDQDVAKADRLADRACEYGGADAVLAEQPDRVAVVRRGTPPLGRADVLGNVEACLDSGDERVFDARSQMGSARRLSSAPDSRCSTETSSVMLRSSRRIRASSTTGYLPLAVTAAANSRCDRVIRGNSSK
jgi:hypothetical protein